MNVLPRPSMTAGFAGPLRVIGGGFLVVAALVAAVGTAYAIGTGSYDFGYLIGVACFAAIGAGLRYGAGLLRGGHIDLTVIGAAIFGLFGLLIVAVGIGLAIDDPEGFLVIAFGLVFVGAGFLVWRVFRTPPGQRMVEVASLAVGGRRQATLIPVDENASEAEIEAARADWVAQRLAARADWAAGRIAAGETRGRNVYLIAGGMWAVLSVVMWTIGWFAEDGFFGFIGFGTGLVAIGLVISGIVRRRRLAKFGDSHLVPEAMPVWTGEVLEGRIETGIAAKAAPPDGFALRLKCIHRYKRTTGSGDRRRTEHHRDTLWQAEATADGRYTARRPGLVVPVHFEVPPDKPASSLGGGDGILWELEVTAAVPGLDYAATFELPVLAPGSTIAARSPASAPRPLPG